MLRPKNIFNLNGGGACPDEWEDILDPGPESGPRPMAECCAAAAAKNGLGLLGPPGIPGWWARAIKAEKGGLSSLPPEPPLAAIWAAAIWAASWNLKKLLRHNGGWTFQTSNFTWWWWWPPMEWCQRLGWWSIKLFGFGTILTRQWKVRKITNNGTPSCALTQYFQVFLSLLLQCRAAFQVPSTRCASEIKIGIS